MKIGSTDIGDVKIGTTDVIEIRIGNIIVWQKPMAMMSVIEEEAPVEEQIAYEEPSPITEEAPQQKKGLFTGMWTYVKNLFGIQ